MGFQNRNIQENEPVPRIALFCAERKVELRLGERVQLHYDYTSLRLPKCTLIGEVRRIEGTRVDIVIYEQVYEDGHVTQREGVVELNANDPLGGSKYLKWIEPVLKEERVS